ncbi:hypothetical protein NP493_1776g00004 [Ridgeia piscesae]|uniref:Uncharacterized protein n=1 Tax=Ridgeia piscesae TaxID=27915 RepID=A0AAD9JTN5_RIDPI|nr:hypothetical protein NP493_1776g00004 [Ridgeia piscesae]
MQEMARRPRRHDATVGLTSAATPLNAGKKSSLSTLNQDGTMALARTSGHVLANPDNMAVFWSRRNQLKLRKTLQVYGEVNGELHLCQNSGRCPQ